LEREVRGVEEAGVAALHLDVMDGHFVPNLSYGLPLVEAIRRLTDLPLDVHLMISNPAAYIERYSAAGANLLTIHVEAVPDPRPVLEQIQTAGCLAGLALNPPTPLERIEPFLSHCDLVLVMSVMPGFGGQTFQAVALDKLTQLRQRVDSQVLLEIDGGVADETIGPCSEAGADLFVVGSAIFRHSHYKTRIEELTQLARPNRASQAPKVPIPPC
jgi:ribulose-phosphate 3-epimerase